VPNHNSSKYCIEIRVEKEHFETLVINHEFFSQINIQEQNEILLVQVIQYGSFTGIFILALVLTLAGRRSYQKKKAEQLIQIREAKAKFDDVSNIIAILVLHRSAGIPVYSKMIKGGFEEGMISSFISAVTSFRSELGEADKLWTAIPISDIVNAVQTNSLICALITGDVPSTDQLERLEAFALKIGALYDEYFEIIRAFSNIELDEIESIVEPAFYNILTGGLLKKYTWSTEKKFSRQYQSLKKTLSRFNQEDGFTPDELVKTLVLEGVDEGLACLLVTQTMEDGIIFESPKNRSLIHQALEDLDEKIEIPYALIPITSDFSSSEKEPAEEILRPIEETYKEEDKEENNNSKTHFDDEPESE
jgi:hypothetical protein